MGIKGSGLWDLPGGPVVKTPCFHCRGPGFDPWSGNLRFWQKKKKGSGPLARRRGSGRSDDLVRMTMEKKQRIGELFCVLMNSVNKYSLNTT